MSAADVELVSDNVGLRRRAPWLTLAADIRHLVGHVALLPHQSFFATFHYMLMFTSTHLYVTHLVSLPIIYSRPLTIDSHLPMNPC